MKRALHILLLSIITSLTFGQEVSVSSSTQQIKIGEQAIISYKVNCSRKSDLEWFDWKDTLIDGIEIVEISNIDTLYDEADYHRVSLTQSLRVTCFDTGLYAVPPQKVLIDDTQYESDPFLISVLTFQIDTTKGIVDIKKPIKTPLTIMDYYHLYGKYILIGIHVLFLVIGLIIYLLKRARDRKKMVIEKPKPLIPPYITALQKLKELKEKELWKKGKNKQYYSELTEIVFIYIEKQLHLPAVEQTTRELLVMVESKPFEDEAKTKLKYLLSTADLVKFAKSSPTTQENELSLQQAIDFIEMTKPDSISLEKEEDTNSSEGIINKDSEGKFITNQSND